MATDLESGTGTGRRGPFCRACGYEVGGDPFCTWCGARQPTGGILPAVPLSPGGGSVSSWPEGTIHGSAQRPSPPPPAGGVGGGVVLVAAVIAGVFLYPLALALAAVTDLLLLANVAGARRRIPRSWLWGHTPWIGRRSALAGGAALLAWALASSGVGYAMYSWHAGQLAIERAHRSATALAIRRSTATAVAWRATATAVAVQTAVAGETATAVAMQTAQAQQTATAVAEARETATAQALARAHATATELTFVRNRPATGTFVRQLAQQGLGQLTVSTKWQLGDALVVLTDRQRVPVVSFYIRAGDSYKLTGIPDGEYVLYFSLGRDWDVRAARFTKDASFRRFEKTLTYTTVWTTQGQEEYMTYSVTLYPVPKGKARTPSVDGNAFPRP